jgi:hypothetical protein
MWPEPTWPLTRPCPQACLARWPSAAREGRGARAEGPAGPVPHVGRAIRAGEVEGGRTVAKSEVVELGSCREEVVAGGDSYHPTPIPLARRAWAARRGFRAWRRSTGQPASAAQGSGGGGSRRRTRGEKQREGESKLERERELARGPYPFQRAAASILADGSRAAHRAAWPTTRSCFRVLRKKMTRELGRAESGHYLLHAGVGSRKSRKRFGPNSARRERERLFFLYPLFYFCFFVFKTFAPFKFTQECKTTL